MKPHVVEMSQANLMGFSFEHAESYLNQISPFVYPTVAVFVVGLCAVAAWLVWYRWQYRRYPPGPAGIPVLGYLPFLPKDMAGFSKLSDVYGDVFHMKMGKKNAVVLGSMEAVRSAFVDGARVFNGRGDVYMIRKLWSDATGVLMAEGSAWRSLRGFAVETLKMDDFTRALQRETIEMIGNIITQGVANVVASWTLGQRIPYVDKVFRSYIENFQEVADLMHHCTFESLIPSLNPLSEKSPKMSRLEEKFKDKIEYITSLIKSHHDGSRQFVNAFMDYGQSDNEDAKLFTEKELVMVVNDIWGAATEASASTLQFAIYYMIKYPDVQRQIQAELDEKTGFPEHNVLGEKDRERLPYTTAALQEVERCASVAPFGVLRCNTEETSLGSYLIPARSLIIPNFWRIHHDPKNWERPEDFWPERPEYAPRNGKVFRPPFLVSYSVGTYSCHAVSAAFKQGFIVLIGSRACPFQIAAASQIFVIFANLMRCFNVTVPDGQFLPAERDMVSALTLRPKDFSVVWTARFPNLLPQVLPTH